MSWDIVLFNSKEKIQSIETLDPNKLIPEDFYKIFESHFKNIIVDGNHREIKGEGFSINYFINEKLGSNIVVMIYNEEGFYELVKLAKIHRWQLFDKSLEEMIDLNRPEINGYRNHRKYLNFITKKE